MWRGGEKQRSGMTPWLLVEQVSWGKTGEGADWGADKEFCPILVCSSGANGWEPEELHPLPGVPTA